VTEVILRGRNRRADLRRYAGKWIAAKDGIVCYGAPDPERVLKWVAANGKSGVTVLRVPRKDEPTTRV
jgi:hypothetical protein